MKHIRKLQAKDKERIREILERTDVFRQEEIDVAIELIDEYLSDPSQNDYQLYSCVDSNDSPVGYVCFGPNTMTRGTFDLYWIAVDPVHQGSGIGKMLLEFTENMVRGQKGRLLLAETSSQPKYDATRAFYVRVGYDELARIKDYYDIGDDMVVYGRYLLEEANS